MLLILKCDRSPSMSSRDAVAETSNHDSKPPSSTPTTHLLVTAHLDRNCRSLFSNSGISIFPSTVNKKALIHNLLRLNIHPRPASQPPKITNSLQFLRG